MEKRERVRKRGKGLGKEGKGFEKGERVWKRGVPRVAGWIVGLDGDGENPRMETVRIQG